MAIKEYELNGEKVYIDDEVNVNETGVLPPEYKSELEHTQELKVISDKELMEDTLTDIFGDNNG